MPGVTPVDHKRPFEHHPVAISITIGPGDFTDLQSTGLTPCRLAFQFGRSSHHLQPTLKPIVGQLPCCLRQQCLGFNQFAAQLTDVLATAHALTMGNALPVIAYRLVVTAF